MAEMKAGYKQTDIGVIPEDWGALPLDHIARVRGGKRLPKGKALTDIANSHPYIRVLDMKNGSVDVSEIKYVPDDVFPEIKNYRIYASDLFISVAGTLGIIGRVPDVLNGANLTENANRICDLKINKEFLFYYLCSNKIQNHIQSMQTVGAQPKLALGRIEKFIIPTPPQESEQKAIASALSDVDGLIEALSQLIAKKRDMKTAAMQQLLTGKKRLPGFDGEWQTPVLEDLADFFKGKFLPKSAISNSGQFSCIHYGELFTHYSEKIKSIRFKTNQPINTSFLSNTNDVLMPTSDVTPNGLAKASCISQNNVILGGDILVIRPKKSTELNGVFLSYFIRFHKDEIMKRVSGTTVYHLYASDIKNLSIDLPGIEEQDAIVSVLEDMSEEIEALEQRLAKALSLKTGMMQELLTGKTRFIKTDKKQKAA